MDEWREDGEGHVRCHSCRYLCQGYELKVGLLLRAPVEERVHQRPERRWSVLTCEIPLSYDRLYLHCL